MSCISLLGFKVLPISASQLGYTEYKYLSRRTHCSVENMYYRQGACVIYALQLYKFHHNIYGFPILSLACDVRRQTGYCNGLDHLCSIRIYDLSFDRYQNFVLHFSVHIWTMGQVCSQSSLNSAWLLSRLTVTAELLRGY
jgi:hypothetical protein